MNFEILDTEKDVQHVADFVFVIDDQNFLYFITHRYAPEKCLENPRRKTSPQVKALPIDQQDFRPWRPSGFTAQKIKIPQRRMLPALSQRRISHPTQTISQTTKSYPAAYLIATRFRPDKSLQ